MVIIGKIGLPNGSLCLVVFQDRSPDNMSHSSPGNSSRSYSNLGNLKVSDPTADISGWMVLSLRKSVRATGQKGVRIFYN